jgi:hypothetical protein
MIDGQIILIESNFNSFIVTCGFNTKMCSSKGNVLMNLNWIKQGKQQVAKP